MGDNSLRGTLAPGSGRAERAEEKTAQTLPLYSFRIDRKKDKTERKILDSQERAFWDVHRPVVRTLCLVPEADLPTSSFPLSKEITWLFLRAVATLCEVVLSICSYSFHRSSRGTPIPSLKKLYTGENVGPEMGNNGGAERGALESSRSPSL